jgi:hypothetical protein
MRRLLSRLWSLWAPWLAAPAILGALLLAANSYGFSRCQYDGCWLYLFGFPAILLQTLVALALGLGCRLDARWLRHAVRVIYGAALATQVLLLLGFAVLLASGGAL